jgi:hypothetical protein
MKSQVGIWLISMIWSRLCFDAVHWLYLILLHDAKWLATIPRSLTSYTDLKEKDNSAYLLQPHI